MRLWICVIAAAAFAGAETLTLDPGRTRVEFTLGDVLHTVHGTFKLAHGNIHFDPQTGKCSGEMTIDAKTGDSGSEARDSRMKKNILETDRYPDIVFLPDHVQGAVPMQGTGRVDVHGIFRIHGADHELTVPVDVQNTNGQLEFKTHFDVPYVQWGMKNPSTLILRVDKTVRIDIDALAHQAP